MIDWLISSPLGGLFSRPFMAIGILLCVAYVSTESAGTHYARTRMSQEEVGLGSGARRSGAAKRRPELAHSTNKTLFLGGLQKD